MLLFRRGRVKWPTFRDDIRIYKNPKKLACVILKVLYFTLHQPFRMCKCVILFSYFLCILSHFTLLIQLNIHKKNTKFMNSGIRIRKKNANIVLSL